MFNIKCTSNTIFHTNARYSMADQARPLIPPPPPPPSGSCIKPAFGERESPSQHHGMQFCLQHRWRLGHGELQKNVNMRLTGAGDVSQCC